MKALVDLGDVSVMGGNLSKARLMPGATLKVWPDGSNNNQVYEYQNTELTIVQVYFKQNDDGTITFKKQVGAGVF